MNLRILTFTLFMAITEHQYLYRQPQPFMYHGKYVLEHKAGVRAIIDGNAYINAWSMPTTPYEVPRWGKVEGYTYWFAWDQAAGPGLLQPLCWISHDGSRYACAPPLRLPIPKELQ